jgi:folylpolyglutamate synthase/dihydropteroate synthase
MVATRSIHPRAIEPAQLVSLAHQYGKPARETATVEAALQTALQLSESEAVVLATGSLFVAMGVRQAWHARQAIPVDA